MEVGTMVHVTTPTTTCMEKEQGFILKTTLYFWGLLTKTLGKVKEKSCIWMAEKRKEYGMVDD